MNKDELFYASIAISLIGFTLNGLGLGKLFNGIWVGNIIDVRMQNKRNQPATNKSHK